VNHALRCTVKFSAAFAVRTNSAFYAQDSTVAAFITVAAGWTGPVRYFFALAHHTLSGTIATGTHSSSVAMRALFSHYFLHIPPFHRQKKYFLFINRYYKAGEKENAC